MNTTTAYTPLECLLLFQSLVSYGTEPDAFVRISDLLRNNGLIKDGETYDPERLSVNALQELYTDLLRDELKTEGENGDGHDAAQTGSRKRKLPSPKLKDAGENKEKLPHLVELLYARYRDHVVRAIREDEKRYAAIQQEISEIERGDWDEKILKEDGALANRNGVAPAKEAAETPNGSAAAAEVAAEPPPPEDKVEEEKAVPQVQEAPNDVSKPAAKVSPPPLLSPRPGSQSGGLAITDVLNNQDAPPPSSPRVAEKRDSTSRGHKESQSVPNLPPINTPKPPSNNGPHGPSPLQPGHPQQGGAWQWEPPYQAAPSSQPPNQPPAQSFQAGGNYPQFSSPQYPPQPYPPSQRGSFSGPHGLPPPHPHVPSSPINGSHPHHIHLPPPNTMHRPPSSPSMPLDALADIAGQQQYRTPSGSPAAQQPQQAPHLPPPPAGYAHPYPPQQPYPQQQWDARSPGINGPPPQWNQPYPPPFQGHPQQYPFNPQYPQQPPQFSHQPNLIAPENRQYNSPYNVSQGPRPQIPFQAPNQSTPKPRPSLPNTPISRGPPRFMTGTGTRWTPTPTASTPRPDRMPEAPQVEPLSPVLKPAKIATVKKSTKKQTLKAQAAKPIKAPAPRRGGAQRGRAGSTASSVVGGSYRSQSVMSHTDELSMDNEVLPSRRVKQEVATPLPMEETGDTTADEGTGRRRKNIRDIASPRPSTKRKRVETVEVREPPAPPTQVLWTRAFPKISASAIEAITGHRIANTFAVPVKERDAPGYSHLILRPQDLKSIKSAIIAGNKAAASVVPDDQGQSSVWLPISEDLIPPKGIINYAQLEKELMRMFANAIMFNADPDRGLPKSFHTRSKVVEADSSTYEIDENGVVKDTRVMFLDVEKTIGDLRSAERRSEETKETKETKESIEKDNEVDELAGDGEVQGTVAKRRRKA